MQPQSRSYSKLAKAGAGWIGRRIQNVLGSTIMVVGAADISLARSHFTNCAATNGKNWVHRRTTYLAANWCNYSKNTCPRSLTHRIARRTVTFWNFASGLTRVLQSFMRLV